MEQIDSITADLLAMKNAIASLIASHPNQAAFLARLNNGEQTLLAALVPSSMTEQFLDAVRAQTQAYREIVGSPRTGS